jgi:hypothetical protein
MQEQRIILTGPPHGPHLGLGRGILVRNRFGNDCHFLFLQHIGRRLHLDKPSVASRLLCKRKPLSSRGAVSFQRLSPAAFIIKGCVPLETATRCHHAAPLSPTHTFSQDIMGIAGVLSVFVEKRKEKPWEVVDSKSVEPVPIFDEDDGACTLLLAQRRAGRPQPLTLCIADVDIIYVHETRVVRDFVFDVQKDKDLENSLLFAQQQFVEEVQRKGYNALWSEGCAQHVLRPCVFALLTCSSGGSLPSSAKPNDIGSKSSTLDSLPASPGSKCSPTNHPSWPFLGS